MMKNMPDSFWTAFQTALNLEEIHAAPKTFSSINEIAKESNLWRNLSHPSPTGTSSSQEVPIQQQKATIKLQQHSKNSAKSNSVEFVTRRDIIRPIASPQLCIS